MHNVIAVDIGGTHFRLGLFDHEGRRLSVLDGETLRSGGRDWMLEQVRARSSDLLKKAGGPVKACGVSFGGPVDFERRRVRSMHAPGWDDFALGEWIEKTLSLPCQVDNDANAGALGEYRFGAGQGIHSLVYITISTGIGSGLVLGGKVFRGRDGLAGEIGHLPVSESGLLCSCGATGCLETLCSADAIAARGREWAARRPESVSRMLELSGGLPEKITSKVVVQAAAEGDSMAAGIINEAARSLARAILSVMRIINPDKIILGGGVAQAGNALLDPVRAFLKELGSPSINYSTEIILAKLENYSPLCGAAAMALDLAGKGYKLAH